MTDIGSRAPRRRRGYAWLAVVPAAAAGAIALVIASQPALAATAPVGLGTTGSFAVLAGTTVTNTGPSRRQRGPRREPGHRGDRVPARYRVQRHDP